ncbi:hypothetical protein DY000_02014914 [Brassica cretica]|uniref:Uncharacterized protein n=1 Tax=Brassica cretica TaxID=69181 RepID=A0ABQ7D5T8_BRACR|nr:hypothetical protein DY000_02014914 [Brassica cretica]
MGQQVKWPQKMKAPDSFRNPGFWCDFHRDHGHKTEDCIELKIEVNELLRKGHLREFLSEKAKSHLKISGISHAAAKRSTWNSKHGLEAAKPKRMLLGTDEISFTAKEQEKFLTPHHDALVISLTIAKCLVKRILVDNGSSSNIIFQAAYKDLGLEKAALTRRLPWRNPSEEVSAVEEGETWMTLLIWYLEADILPEDRSEGRKIKKQAARYCISQEKLYQRYFSGPYLRCVTPQEAARILVELHEGD